MRLFCCFVVSFIRVHIGSSMIYIAVFITDGMPQFLFQMTRIYCLTQVVTSLDSKAHGANMGPIWRRQDPGGSHVGPMNFAILDHLCHDWHHQEAVLSVWFFPNPSRSFQGFVPLKMRTNWSFWSTIVTSKPFFSKIHDHGSQTSKFLCGTS